jgi:hypothetical protein
MIRTGQLVPSTGKSAVSLMKYLLAVVSGATHFWGGAQILTMDDKLHTKSEV